MQKPDMLHEAKSSRLRPMDTRPRLRPKLWPKCQSGLGSLNNKRGYMIEVKAKSLRLKSTIIRSGPKCWSQVHG